MDLLSLYPVIPIILLALLTMKMMSRLLGITPAKGHFAAIDGLRGFLAFFVFLHHGEIWYVFLRNNLWAAFPADIYSHFGPGGVSLFFMITSFLFCSKLLGARGKTMDWLKLYISRALRIQPLYLAALFILFFIVAALSHFTMHVPLSALARQTGLWLLFIQTDLNGLTPTKIIIAGVVWSLAFEWLFYFTLPLLSVFLKVRVTPRVLLPALAGVLLFALLIFYNYPLNILARLTPFAGGCLAAFLVRHPKAADLASGSLISAVITLCLIISLIFSPSIYDPIPMLLLTAAFTGIACGNDLFGLLTLPLAGVFGQISYSLYLLHGLILFACFRWVIGFRTAAGFNFFEHWCMVGICSIVVVSVCSLTYRFIERPALNMAPRITQKLKKLLRSANYSSGDGQGDRRPPASSIVREY